MQENKHIFAKGTINLMFAQIIFLGSGYVIHFGLARLVDPVEYGRFGVILSILMITQIFLNRGIPETVSKFISEGKDSKIVKRKSLEIQLVLSIIISLMVFILAPFISDILHDSILVDYIRLVSFIIPIRAILSIFRGVLNGFRLFKKTAIVNILNAIFRIFFVFLFVFFGFEIFGAVGGYIFGAAFALLFAYVFSRKNVKGEKVSSKDVFHFSIPMIGFVATYTIIQNFDIFFVKSLISNQEMAGFYTSARAISSIVFGVVITLSITLLPSISKSYAKKDFSQVKNYIRESVRYLLIFLLPLGIVISCFSKEILSLFFPVEYVVASGALSVLIFGTILLAFVVVFGSIFNGIGKPMISFVSCIFLFLLDVVLNYFLVIGLGIVGSAYALLITGVVGFFLFSSIVFSKFRVLIDFMSFLKISLSGIFIVFLIYLIKSFFEIKNISLILVCLILLFVYFISLMFLKEIKRSEIDLLKNIIKI